MVDIEAEDLYNEIFGFIITYIPDCDASLIANKLRIFIKELEGPE